MSTWIGASPKIQPEVGGIFHTQGGEVTRVLVEMCIMQARVHDHSVRRRAPIEERGE